MNTSPSPRRIACLSACTLLAALAGHALAQAPAATPTTSPTTPTPTPASGPGAAAPAASPTATPAQTPPGLLVGARARVIQRIPVAPTVLIAPDASSYARAIGSWSVQVRYPVLFDDGTHASARRIARFVRAFAPMNVVRLPAAKELGNDPTDAGDRPWPATTTERQNAMLEVVASAWRDGPAPLKATELKEQWAKLKYEPVGAVIADADDPAWAGALALAAGRGQVLLFPSIPRTGKGDINGVYSAKEAGALSQAIADALSASGFTYSALGDQIDVLTFCHNGPLKYSAVAADPSQVASLSDALGRNFAAGEAAENTRWAWSGQVVGNESQSAYLAMCSMFLPTDTAWLFDAYDTGGIFGEYDLGKVAPLFTQFGVRATLDDTGRQGLEDWRRRAAGTVFSDASATAPGSASNTGDATSAPSSPPPIQRGVDDRLIFVNSSGNPEYFDLRPGQAFAADVPYMRAPGAVYFVHSWSASGPASLNTVGARWLERGAFQYVGSVQEPYLQGFLPPFNVAARYLSGMPWAAAVRYDNTGVWKIINLGDPLMLAWPKPKDAATKPGPTRLPEPMKIKVGQDLAELMGKQLKAKDFPSAFRSLAMLGRDQDIVKLVRAMLDDPAKPLTPPAAVEALESVYFYADTETFRRVFEAALPLIKSDAALMTTLDMPWHVYGTMVNTLRQPEADLLQQCVRQSPEALKQRDTDEATKALKSAAERGG